jgi:hypothetical protein
MALHSRMARCESLQARFLCRACNWRGTLAPLENFHYPQGVYAQKLSVDVIIGGERKLCPMDWLDQFSMRNFTNSAEFDDTLPVADGRLEASFRVDPQHLADALGAWLTQRGKGAGQPVKVEVRKTE